MKVQPAVLRRVFSYLEALKRTHMKYCKNCGAQLPDDAQFCGSCGTPCEPVSSTPYNPQPAQAPYAAPSAPAPDYAAEADDSVRLCPDGLYRWVYELNMFKSTAILGTLFKVLGIAIGVVWLLICIMNGFEDFGQFTLLMLGIFAGICVLSLLAYLIVAAVNGGKYCVLFEMNETGLRHIQLPKQYKKAQVLSWIAMLAGAIAGNPTGTGAGLLAASRNSLVSEFPKVRSIKADPAHNIIRVNAPLSKNQVYVKDADFDFVLNFIRSHCPKAQ